MNSLFLSFFPTGIDMFKLSPLKILNLYSNNSIIIFLEIINLFEIKEFIHIKRSIYLLKIQKQFTQQNQP